SITFIFLYLPSRTPRSSLFPSTTLFRSELKPGFDSLGNVGDIVSNPRHLKFKKIDDTTGPRVLNSVGAALISNTVALEGNLNVRSEEHTSELQSRFDLVCRLLLEKKNIH